jgi:hypothetical protein
MKKKRLWVAGTCLDAAGHVSVLLQDSTGAIRIDSLEDLTADVGAEKCKREDVTVQLGRLVPSNTETYLQAVGLAHLKGDKQTSYEVHADIGPIVIPAQLLILATLAFHINLREIILSPVNPAELSQAHIFENNVVMQKGHYLSKVVGRRFINSSIKAIQWLQTYPSARAAWASVYRNSLDGRLDLTIPACTLTASIHSNLVDGKRYVTRLIVKDLFPEEKPFPYAHAARISKLTFSDKGAPGVRRLPRGPQPKSDARLQGMEIPNIDERQWRQIEALLFSPHGIRKHCLRLIVETIINKFSIGYSWKNGTGTHDIRVCARISYQRWSRSGQWSKVMDILVPDSMPGIAHPLPTYPERCY